MKPQNKFQRHILTCKLRPITQKQKDWAITHNAEKYFVISRKTTFCLECGHKWKVNTLLLRIEKKCVCPACSTKLSLCQDHSIDKVANYFAILTTHKGFQVVRMFIINQYFKKRKACDYHISEVMQHWIKPDGKWETLSKQTYGRSMYYDSWAYHTELEVHTRSQRHELRCNLRPWKIYPGRNILPIIKRNGFKGHFHDFVPHKLYSLLLADNRAETLFKAGQVKLLEKSRFHTGNIEQFWSSIRICMRHGYTIQEPDIWFDYLHLLNYFGKDILNPKVICSNRLYELHDRLSKRKTKIVKHQNNLMYQKQYEKEKAKFFGLVFKEKNLVIQPLQTIEEFKEEAQSLGHCVYSNNYFEKTDSLILSAKIDDTPTETIEFSLKELEIV